MLRRCIWPALSAACLTFTSVAPAQEKPAAPRTEQKPAAKIATSRPSAAASKPADLAVSPEFQTKTITGLDLNFPDDYTGKLVLVDVWATWCPYCRAELPNWVAAYEQLHDQGLEVVGIVVDKSKKRSRDLVSAEIEKLGVPWQNVYEDGPTLSMKFGATSIPMSFLIDADSGEVLLQRGKLRGKAIVAEIQKQLDLKRRRTEAAAAAASPAAEKNAAAGDPPASGAKVSTGHPADRKSPPEKTPPP